MLWLGSAHLDLGCGLNVPKRCVCEVLGGSIYESPARSLKTSKLTPCRSLDYALTGLSVPAFPAPTGSSIAHFSAAEFFRDCPWLNVPSHRKADILVEPLYPRLGLLGGASESGGKLSKLAALAAERKKKEGDTAQPSSEPPSKLRSRQPEKPSPETRSPTPSLRDRLAAKSATTPKPSEAGGGLRKLGKSDPSPSSARRQPSPSAPKAAPEPTRASIEHIEDDHKVQEPHHPAPILRASPSMFASAIVGSAARPEQAEPSQLHSNSVDLLRIYGQENAEPFDFAGPSPDDVVLNAQNTAKGLAIRRKG